MMLVGGERCLAYLAEPAATTTDFGKVEDHIRMDGHFVKHNKTSKMMKLQWKSLSYYHSHYRIRSYKLDISYRTSLQNYISV